jgi:hypothetical protein
MDIESVRETNHLRLLRWNRALDVYIDGRHGEAAIILPTNSSEPG